MSAADFANGQRLTENEDIRRIAPLNLPLGYAYAATYAGIRQVEKDDLALIVTGLPASAAAVFTQNRVQAAPVKLCRRHLKLSGGLVGAILVNAGNANCATRTGDAVALATCQGSRETPAAAGLAGAAGLHRRDRRGTRSAENHRRPAAAGRAASAPIASTTRPAPS